MIFNIIGWIIFGLIVGAIARFIIPGADSHGWIGTILLGVGGSFLGGFIGQTLFGSGSENSKRYGGWVLSILGAVILQLLYRWLM